LPLGDSQLRVEICGERRTQGLSYLLIMALSDLGAEVSPISHVRGQLLRPKGPSPC
jgi:hypothetical protein